MSSQDQPDILYGVFTNFRGVLTPFGIFRSTPEEVIEYARNSGMWEDLFADTDNPVHIGKIETAKQSAKQGEILISELYTLFPDGSLGANTLGYEGRTVHTSPLE